MLFRSGTVRLRPSPSTCLRACRGASLQVQLSPPHAWYGNCHWIICVRTRTRTCRGFVRRPAFGTSAARLHMSCSRAPHSPCPYGSFWHACGALAHVVHTRPAPAVPVWFIIGALLPQPSCSNALAPSKATAGVRTSPRRLSAKTSSPPTHGLPAPVAGFSTAWSASSARLPLSGSSGSSSAV